MRRAKPVVEPAPRPPELWCPELPEGVAFLRQVRWHPPTAASRGALRVAEALQRCWDRARVHIWSTEALMRAAKVLLDVGWVTEAEALLAAHIGELSNTTRYPLTAELLAVCPETPSCWWHAHPEGFIEVLDRETQTLVPMRGIVVWAEPAAQRLVLLALDGTGEPWTGVIWPVGLTREQVVAQLRAHPEAGPTTVGLASVMTLGVLGGLLAQLGGLVVTADVETAAGHGWWSCLPEELPPMTERPS